ncbi:transcription factor bHLH130 isoform X1 [Cannabis sativa]|uniref:BHLH domain-containing protein n=2 Tax=Cannabis sativa TaxID=3483 RepID=A0AB40E7Z5_CANSA|nr:transcription factor bHLH130 isoform X1 [Cannabis sativa]KAF4366067.1 hypothetical protein F8388_012181 [Cannabis sativa]KAF4397766.1 hypothetical protein G4B88_025258 [Cannabis sativa]
MSLLYSPNFKRSEVEMGKNYPEFMDLSFDQNQEESSTLTRYCSAPGSFLATLMENSGNNDNDAAVEGGSEEDYRDLRSSSPEVETMLERFISACNGSDNIGERSSMKQEPKDYSKNGSQAPQIHSIHRLNSVDSNLESSFGVFNSKGLVNSLQPKMGPPNDDRSNLLRQSSSPAGFFSALASENSFDAMRGGSRVDTQLNFSSGSASCSRRMPQISENGSDEVGIENGGEYLPSFPTDSWDESAFSGLKRSRDHNDVKIFSTSSDFEMESTDFGNCSRGLTHHLSLPKNFEMAPREKVLHFQGSVPCKMRAKRGYATHPRSIAERNRRTRISERIRRLQDLCPNMDKQTNTADMLELVVDYIKDLQKEVKTLSDTKAKCSCLSKNRKSSSPSA